MIKIYHYHLVDLYSFFPLVVDMEHGIGEETQLLQGFLLVLFVNSTRIVSHQFVRFLFAYDFIHPSVDFIDLDWFFHVQHTHFSIVRSYLQRAYLFLSNLVWLYFSVACRQENHRAILCSLTFRMGLLLLFSYSFRLAI